MRKKNFKGRCVKRSLSKCVGVCRTYDEIQYAYADVLESMEGVKEFRCNVVMEGLELGEYMTDFVYVIDSDETIVRECVQRSHLTKPMTLKLLDASREYWLSHGVNDWGLVINEE